MRQKVSENLVHFVAENYFLPCSAALPYPATARIRSAFELALGFGQLRPAQAQRWPRAHSSLQAVSQGMLEVATQEKLFRPQIYNQGCCYK